MIKITHGSFDKSEGCLGDRHVGRLEFIVNDRLLVDFAFLERVEHYNVADHGRLSHSHTTTS